MRYTLHVVLLFWAFYGHRPEIAKCAEDQESHLNEMFSSIPTFLFFCSCLAVENALIALVEDEADDFSVEVQRLVSAAQDNVLDSVQTLADSIDTIFNE